MLVLMPMATRWSFAILSSVRAQEDLDLMRADLAVAQERLRIARDLHDVFGRTLTTVAVKAELAAALADAEEAPRAAAESRNVRALADDALKEVRAVLAEYRRPDLATELAGAHSLLASAGIATRTIGETAIPVWAAEPLALVLREAVTNVVRHSEARSCTIRVALDDDGAALTVTNDGARDPAAEAGSADAITLAAPGPTHKGTASGLASLSERIEAVGGTLAAHRKRDDFTVTARVPRPPAPSTEPAQPAPARSPRRQEKLVDPLD